MHKVLNSYIIMTVILITHLGWIFGVSAVICVKKNNNEVLYKNNWLQLYRVISDT